MRKIILVGMLSLTFSSFISLNAQWAKSYGMDGDDEICCIRQTIDGGYIVAGRSFPADSDVTDIWILKLTPTGNIEWQKTYGEQYSESAHDIKQTIDGGHILAGSGGGVGILKLDQDGEIEWQRRYYGAKTNSIQQTYDGGYIVAGQKGSAECLVLKLSSNGEIEWQKSYVGAGMGSIVQTSEGGYVVVDTSSADFGIFKLTSTGEIEWQHVYGGSHYDSASSIQQTYDGGYIIAGSTRSFSTDQNDYDMWILKLSSEGDIKWQKTYGGSGNDNALCIQQTNDEGYIVSGCTTSFSTSKGGGYDFIILKLSSKGKIEWQKTYGAGHDERAYSIQQTYDGGFIVAGSTQSFGAGGDDFWIFKLDPNGELNPYCDLVRSKNGAITVAKTNVSPEDTDITPQDTNIEPQDTNISPQDTSAIVYDFCSGNYILRINTVSWQIGSSPCGNTKPSPGMYFHSPGEVVTIDAIAPSGCSFVDWYGDASGTANQVTVTMDSHKYISAGFYPVDIDEDSLGDESCFIATAAFGSPLYFHVRVLQDFRDKFLMSNKFGRKLVNLYYKHSPFIGNFIIQCRALRFIVRISLIPVVTICCYILQFGP